MIVGIIQARMGSTRLPGKVNMPIFGKPMLQREIERVKKTRKVDTWILATSDTPADDVVAAIAAATAVECFRGSEKDVLDRYYHAAKNAQADVVVRITGDCPLHDANVIDNVVQRFAEMSVDYAKTPEEYPEGVDTEVCSFAALETSWNEASLPSEREHVTLFIRNHPDRFKLDQWRTGGTDYSEMHWSVDTPQDLAFVTKIFEHFGEREFGMQDVIAYLSQHPELLEINKGGTGFEGLAKSLKEDEEWKKNHGL